jgi:hypothetical protein
MKATLVVGAFFAAILLASPVFAKIGEPVSGVPVGLDRLLIGALGAPNDVRGTNTWSGPIALAINVRGQAKIVRNVSNPALGSREMKTADQHLVSFAVTGNSVQTVTVAATQFAAPASSTARSVILELRPCLNKAGAAVDCKKRPDLTAGPSITVGGHVTPWKGNVTLTDADADPQFKPYCAFTISYMLRNVGLGNAGPPATPAFHNTLLWENNPVYGTLNRQYALSLAASTNWTLHPMVYLLSGVHRLYLNIDAGNDVAEANENNNLFYVTYRLTGNCKDHAMPIMQGLPM